MYAVFGRDHLAILRITLHGILLLFSLLSVPWDIRLCFGYGTPCIIVSPQSVLTAKPADKELAWRERARVAYNLKGVRRNICYALFWNVGNLL